ncbi:pseudouridine synthase [Chelativorans sp.]|uniref:pseudouridine synthase n=1 Tax=Chelativorans sp. TaxID=2203393 RepID=UPI0028117987|nr:pseudouridine synthase [Chelativorans sp.]
MKDKKDRPARPKRADGPRARAAGPGKGPEREEARAGEGGERIAKRLARAGVASRRDAEAMVEAGRVKVNGRLLTSPAFNVRPTDRIEIDGAPIPEVERTRLFLFHKPAGVVTTSRDPEGRRTIFDILPEGLPRLITVGRLDINTEGLLLLTNDGGLARVLELPATGWLRRYRVRVHGKVDPLALAELEKGTAVDGVFYGAISATMDRQQGSNAWLTLGLREGKNREVKNVLGALGLDVTRLIRISYGPFQLGELPEGAIQEIKGRTLRDQLGERLIEEAGANFEAPIARPFVNKPVRAERPRPEKSEDARKPGRERPEAAEKKFVNRKKEREEKREEMRDRLQTQRPERPRWEQRPERRWSDDRRATPGRDERPGRPGRDERPARSGKDERPRRMREDGDEARPARNSRPAGAGKDARAARSRGDARPGRVGRDDKASRPVERRSRSANVWMAPGARPVGRKRAEEAAEASEGKPAGRAGKAAAGAQKRRPGATPPGKGGRSPDRPPRGGPGGKAQGPKKR